MTTVKVCDAIMGSGKTSAAITYINEHPEKKFIYVTPYLDEAARIKEGCPDAFFVEPEILPQYHNRKTEHTTELIMTGRNVATTHAALMRYDDEICKCIKEGGYCVIIDEEINVLSKEKELARDDLELLLNADIVRRTSDGEYTAGSYEYGGGRYSDIYDIIRSRTLLCLEEKKKAVQPYYWRFSKRLFESADEVIVMTYMFGHSELQMFFNIYDIPYKYIGIHREDMENNTVYRFSNEPDYIPDYTKNLKNMIHIEQGERINRIGDKRTACSDNWYKNREHADKMLKNIYNYFRNHIGGPAKYRMCAYFRSMFTMMKDAGYKKHIVIFNERSRNRYSDRTVLAYPVNTFANTYIKRYYASLGQQFDDDHYALSTMLQWIWRSAIRNGEEIYIYVPSKRMRTLLMDWIEAVSTGEEVR